MRELLEVAVREGYFEVPRGCTLAELAERVGVDRVRARYSAGERLVS